MFSLPNNDKQPANSYDLGSVDVVAGSSLPSILGLPVALVSSPGRI